MTTSQFLQLCQRYDTGLMSRYEFVSHTRQKNHTVEIQPMVILLWDYLTRSYIATYRRVNG